MWTVEAYQFLWDNISRYYLMPSELSHTLDREFKYVIHKKELLEFAFVFVPSNIMPAVIDKLIEAGIEIVTEPIDWENFMNIERLWTDLVDEIALVPADTSVGYGIYWKEIDEIFRLPALATK